MRDPVRGSVPIAPTAPTLDAAPGGGGAGPVAGAREVTGTDVVGPTVVGVGRIGLVVDVVVEVVVVLPGRVVVDVEVVVVRGGRVVGGAVVVVVVDGAGCSRVADAVSVSHEGMAMRWATTVDDA